MQLPRLVNHESAVVLDIRNTEEFAQGHIAKSLNLPKSDLSDKLKTIDKHKAKPIILVCENGISSNTSAGILHKAGFETLYQLTGGLQAWRKENMPLIRK